MKELTIEEKAERYEKALVWMQNLYPTMEGAMKEDAEHYFPELKEREDEKIKNALIRFHKSTIDVDGIKGENIIAWLEKQGEYKSPEEVLKIRQELYQSGYNDGYKHGCEDSKKQDKQILANSTKNCEDEQNPAENRGMNLVEEKMTPFQREVFGIIDLDIENEQGLKQVCDKLLALASNEIKQKPTEWSEDDESIALGIEQIVNCASLLNIAPDKLYKIRNWLKLLKDRVGYEANCTTMWKPCEQDILLLARIANGKSNPQDFQASLGALIEQLKKL